MILAFDTSAAHVAAALLDRDNLRAARSEDMSRGQAERLLPLLAELLDEAGATWSDVTRIGVGIGPGNFTGIRISVATARGLALGLGRPAVGVSLFDTTRDLGATRCTAVPAPRGQLYLFDPDAMHRPELRDMAQAPACARSDTFDPLTHVVQIARIAARAPADGPRPAPLYVRPADAAPASDPPPVILDDA